MGEDLTEIKLLELFKEFNKNRIDYNTRKWETVKFFQSIFSALIVGFVGTLIAAFHFGGIDKVAVQVGLFFIPICSFVALKIGIENLTRESKALFKEEISMFKILKFISLPEKVPTEKRWIRSDEYLLPPKYRNPEHGVDWKGKEPNWEDWLKSRVKKHYFLRLFTSLFGVEMGISLVLATLVALRFPYLLLVLAAISLWVLYLAPYHSKKRWEESK